MAEIYKVLRPLEHDLKRYEIGDSISFGADDASQSVAEGLLAIGVLGDFDTPPGAALDADQLAAVDALSKLSVAELTALAQAEGVSDVPEKAKKDVLIAAIQAHRMSVPPATADPADPATN